MSVSISYSLCLYLRRFPSVSVRVRTLFSMLSSLWGSSLRNFTASTSTLSTARMRAWRAGNSPARNEKKALLLFCESSSVRKTPWHLNLFLHVGLWNVVKWEVFPWRCEMWVYSVQRCHYSTFIVTKCVTGQVLLYLIPTKLWSLSRWIYHNSLLQGHSWPTVSASCIALTCVGRSNNREYSTSCN